MFLTMEKWDEFVTETGKHNWYDFAKVGDEVNQDIINYFINILYPRICRHNFIQVGRIACDYVKNEQGFYRGIFITFAIVEGAWHYYGNCFLGETKDMSNTEFSMIDI